MVYTDDAAAYVGHPELLRAKDVKHSASEYVDGMAQYQWDSERDCRSLKRADKGKTLHKISPKHLQRYVSEFSGKHNVRDSGTVAQMRDTVARLVGRNLLYREGPSSPDNGLSSGDRVVAAPRGGTALAPASRDFAPREIAGRVEA